MQLTAGICAAKALVQHLCDRFHDPENVQVFISGDLILSRRKFCVQEVLLHICLASPAFNFKREREFLQHTYKRILYSLIFALKVFLLIPSVFAALSWFPPVSLRTMLISDLSTSESTVL